MIAHLTRAMIALQLLLLAGLGLWFTTLAGVGWAVALLAAAGLMLLLRALLIFNNYLLSGALRQPTAAGTQAALPALAARMAQEFWCSMLCWYRLFPAGRAFFVPADDRGLPPVLMLHGYGANSAFWRPFSRTLGEAGISHAAIDLEPVLGSIDDYAPQIDEAVERLVRDCDSPGVILLCHSMGGLAARAWLRAAGGDRAIRVITLGTPHFGSTLAAFGPGRNARQMLPPSNSGSSWLHELAASEHAGLRALFLSIYSRQDNIVAPQSSAVLPGARNHALDLIGHVALGFDQAVQQQVLEEIISIRQSRSTAGNQ